MIPKNFKINTFQFTRIPKPVELFRRTGFSQVANLGLYDNEGTAESGRKIDLISREFQKLEDSSRESSE